MNFHKSIVIVFLTDSVLIAASLYSAYAIRFEFQIPDTYLTTMLHLLPWIVSLKLLTFFGFHLYRGMWRYTNLADVLNLLKATIFSSGLVVVVILLLYGFEDCPRCVFILDSLLTFLFIAGFRVGIRLYYHRNSCMKFFPSFFGLCQRGKKCAFVETSSVLLDMLLIIIAFQSAYALRFGFRIPDKYFQSMLTLLPLVVLIKISVFTVFHLYQGIWHYAGLVDFINIGKATLLSSALIMIQLLFMRGFDGYPRSVYLIDCGLTFLLICGVRVGARLYYLERRWKKSAPLELQQNTSHKRLLIIGAGDAGENLVREILEKPHLSLYPIGLVDDDSEMHGKTVHGIKVLGSVCRIESFQALFDEILIAVPSASAQQMRRIVDLCKETGKRFRTVPALEELIDGNVSMKTVRDVTLEDLLGREEVTLSKDDISRYIRHRRVLVTGAGGSIGSELVRQICHFEPEALAFVEMSEYNLFCIDLECRQRFGSVNTAAYLADIRDQKIINHIFHQFQPQVVFHAAAYKHVPLQEQHPWEAVQNNVIGTQNMVQAALDFQVERFVLVSTDKAVRPTNVMGATKRVAEKIVAAANHVNGSRFMAVRFGNVMGSSGSVIPIFQEQIARGGPVTVTHPEVTRYFMSIPEAAQLILEAGAKGEGGEIFLLNMGQPVRIVSLAQELIRLYGYEPGRDIQIKYIGLRPGEKLYEELITEGEGIVKTDHKKIMVLSGNGFNIERLRSNIQELSALVRTFDTEKIRRKLQEILPEYAPQNQGLPREYARYASDIPILYQPADIPAEYKEQVCNISRGGLCFYSHELLEQGTSLLMKFPFLSSNVEESGTVVWSEHVNGCCKIGVRVLDAEVNMWNQLIESVCHIEENKPKLFHVAQAQDASLPN